MLLTHAYLDLKSRRIHGLGKFDYKIQHRPVILQAIKAIGKYLSDHEQIRHTLIHRHSLIDADLKKIELFYLNDFEHVEDEDRVRIYKYVRTEKLKSFLSTKKIEFKKINNDLYGLIDALFISLKPEYESQKKIVL